MPAPFRLPPKLPPQAVKTYSVVSPLATHFRPASCDEINCDAWRGGWRTIVDEATDLGARQAAYIRDTGIEAHVAASEAARLAGTRRYTESREGALTAFTFPAGTRCFSEHKVPVGRPELFVVKGGDWRGNPRGTPTRQHASGADWVEDFAEHQDRLAVTQQKG